MARDSIIDELGLDFKPDYSSKNQDVEKLFKAREDERVDLLKESIVDIKRMISEREFLHKEMMENLDKLNMFIDNSMPKGSFSSDEAIKARHDLVKELLKKKIEIEEIKVEEKLNFWRDVAELKKELREHMKEYRDMESKTSMMDNLLEM